MKQKTYWILAFCIGLILSPTRAADVREGLVSYWPLDSLAADFQSTPDIVSSNTMIAVNFFDASAVVPGTRGNAVQFDGDLSQRHLYFITPDGADTGLPISRARTYSILMWVKGKGTGQSDRNIYSESSSVNTDPLQDFGTHSTGADDTLDFFLRNSGTQINHARTTITPLDDLWHHIAWTDNDGQIRVYVDGQLSYSNNIAHGPTPKDTTSIAATVRLSSGTPIQYFFTGLIDDMAVWDRTLSQAEVQNVMTNGVQTPVPAFGPLITVQPRGSTNLLVGDSHAMSVSAAAGATRPLTYQWRNNSGPITGATSSTLILTNLAVSDSGDYWVVVSNSVNSATSTVATLLVSPVPPANLTNGMVSFWPLDEVQGTKTPDVVRGYDVQLINFTAADVVPGRWGNALQFASARNTMLERENLLSEQLSLYTKNLNFTVSLWVNGAGNQQDKRVFSESSTTGNQPLFNIGTHQTAASGVVDTYIRRDNNSTVGDHQWSFQTAYDGTWHHIVYVQRELVSGSPVGVLYIDAVRDEGADQPSPVRPLTANVTSIGGVRRGSAGAPSRQFIFDGLIDDVAVWNRALSEEEISLLHTNGTPRPGSVTQPLSIRGFKADFPAVGQGDSVTLRWDVSKDATSVEIDQGVGDVTANTVTGLGSAPVTITQNRTFTLTVRRGAESLTAQTTVAAVSGVGANWALLDNFDTYPSGPFPSTYWGDLGGNSMIIDVAGNKMLDMRGTARIALLSLNELKVTEGQARTLFARFIVQGDPAVTVRNFVGLTDRGLRFVTDVTDGGGAGPYARVSNELTDLMVGARNGVLGTVDFYPPVVESNSVYSLWIDVTNQPIAVGDLFTIWLQKQGDATRTQILTDYLGDRDPLGDPPAAGGAPTRPDLDKIFAGNDGDNSVFFDDFYVSKAGYNVTVPRPLSVQPPSVSITRTVSQVQINWTEGVLESTASIGGQWSDVQGAAPPTYMVTPTESQRYFRVRR